MEKAVKPLHCRRCGSMPTVGWMSAAGYKVYIADCPVCREGFFGGANKNEAIENWNKRQKTEGGGEDG